MKYYQQGDVLIKKCNKKLENGEPLNHLVLAEGESTNHSHRIVSGVANLIMLDKILHLQVFSDTALLKHEEHNKIEIPRGNYEIGIVKEFDYDDWEERRVVD